MINLIEITNLFMIKKFNIITFLLVVLSFILASADFYIFDNKSNIISFKNEDDIRHKISNFKNQLESEKLYFDELVLPSYTSFYQIHNNTDINVSVTSEQFVNAGNINSLEIEKILKNSDSKNRYFPLKNLIVSEEMVFRGIVVKQITYYPFRIDY